MWPAAASGAGVSAWARTGLSVCRVLTFIHAQSWLSGCECVLSLWGEEGRGCSHTGLGRRGGPATCSWGPLVGGGALAGVCGRCARVCRQALPSLPQPQPGLEK